MIQNFSLFCIGLLILSFGAKWIVSGSSNIALVMGIRPIIIGLTIVSIGTSLPEFVVSFVAAINETKDIALGNIIGSNIANIGLVLGLAAMVRPLKMNETTIKKEIPIMVGTSILFYLLALDKQISALDGFILIVGIILFLVYCFYVARYDKNQAKNLTQEYHIPTNKNLSVKHEFLLIMSGVVGIILGARLMVDSAVNMAREFGLSELFIGMTIVAVGTSVPELATSMVAAFQNKDEISVGNVVGSNIFNIGMVVGIIAMISPFSVEAITLKREFLIMLTFSVILFLMVLQQPLLTRVRGLLLLIGYFVFIWFTF